MNGERKMEYIGQIFTGGWEKRNYRPEEIMERLKEITAIVPLSKVIIGWNTDPETYRIAGRWLHSRGMKMLLWLPVFSEIGELLRADDAIDINGNQIGNLALQEGENFAFYCPSSERNIQNVFSVYENRFSGCGFDGIFLDKIRSQSFVSGKSGILSCCCRRCGSEYAKLGFSIGNFRKSYAGKGDHLFDIRGEDGLDYLDSGTEAYFAAKEKIIADSVNRICRYFRSMDMEIGLDLYAPLLSRTVGQNYELISREADFIKPMLYRRTEAPAGIGYEYEMMRKALPAAEGYGELKTDEDFLRRQLHAFSNLPVKKYPGLEVNYRSDIARTDPEYVRRSLQIFAESGMDGAVLAWDLMLAPDSHLAAVKQI